MLLMENFSPFAAAFRASRGFIQTLSCTETGEVEAQREGCKTGGEQVMINRGELVLLSSSPQAEPWLHILSAPSSRGQL